jgi:hypothetical protein
MATSGGTGSIQTVGSGNVAQNQTFPFDAAALFIADTTSSSWQRIQSARSLLDGAAGSNAVPNMPFQFNGASWDQQRTPKVFTTLSAVAIGSEATIWTPASGKKFRLMGFVLASGTVGGGVTLKDNTAGITIFIVPTLTVSSPVHAVLGNGILSAAANNVLTATGIATETLTGTVWGTEE